MNIDQRIEALTKYLQLTAHEISDLRAATAEHDNVPAERNKVWAERDNVWAERDKLTALELSHIRENLSTLAQSANTLLSVANRHKIRISRVEGQVNS